MKARIQEEFQKHQDRYMEEWKQLLRFPSISADPEHKQDCHDCATWLVEHLKGMGFEARLYESEGKPVVYAEREGDSTKPTILYYGHYDVQPVDPLDLWETPPFEPTLKNGRLYARGAQDNKGQLFYTLKAMEMLIQSGAALPTIRITLEGEEESSGQGLEDFAKNNPDLVKADALLVTDTGSVDLDSPTITMSLRGIILLTLSLTGAKKDLHSGVHGGIAPNPAHAMARLLATLHHPNGRIAVEGFYDAVPSPTPRERERANDSSISNSQYKELTGVLPLAGDPASSPAERVGFQPCLDVNGIDSGYTGEGFKTIIPSRAMAKVSARLVAEQDPEHGINALVKHLEKHTPTGLQLAVETKSIGGRGIKLSLDSPLTLKAEKVLSQVADKQPTFKWCGASIPIVSELVRISGAEPLLLGFGQEADNIHAPNESFSLAQFEKGYLSMALMLMELSSV